MAHKVALPGYRAGPLAQLDYPEALAGSFLSPSPSYGTSGQALLLPGWQSRFGETVHVKCSSWPLAE